MNARHLKPARRHTHAEMLARELEYALDESRRARPGLVTTSPLDADVDAGGHGAAARAYKLIPILGAPASGKSSLMAELLELSVRKGRDARVLDPAGNWPGVGEWPRLSADKEWRSDEKIADAWLVEFLTSRDPHLGQNPKPCALFIDDADTFLDGAKARGPFRRLFTTFRHYRLDVIITGRRTQDLPKIVFTSATGVYLFRHFVSVDYIRREYGPAAANAIPAEDEPFHYSFLDVETREITEGQTHKREQRTASDGA